MNKDVTRVVVDEDHEDTTSFKDEGELVELGEVSKDTEGFGFVFPDGGIGNRW